MSFDVSAGAYLRFMGRYSEPLGSPIWQESVAASGRWMWDAALVR